MTIQDKKTKAEIIEITNEILKLVDDADMIPRTDVQGIAMAIALKIIQKRRTSENK